MRQEEMILYAPYIVMGIAFALQYKIFMTPADFQKEKADFMQYIADNYVSDKTYSDNHKALQGQMLQIHQDVSDVKNILIGIVNNKNQRN